jgi:hypothetical protein
VSAFRWVWRDRRGGVERETERSFARFISSNLRIDLLGIVSALGERLVRLLSPASICSISARAISTPSIRLDGKACGQTLTEIGRI